MDDPIRRAPASDASGLDATDSLPAGFVPPNEVLGRYVVLYRLGTGGMGVVYAAYDPKLDRKVALKLLRRKSSDAAKRERAQQHLLDEARAMARLSHANVITVHDVAVVDARVVVAMEFVDGRTLTGALVHAGLGWQEVLRIMLKAGQGLAAAHEAGLVHRDFKPDNVMLAKDGRVLVMDFGLAQALDRDGGGTSQRLLRRDLRQGSGSQGTASASTGNRGAGTPAYMAPEQHRGGDADGRSDQFSFCVTLYEALYGHRPFQCEGRVEAEVFERAVCKGLPDPPKHSKVPAFLRAVVAQGLSAAPEDRYPAMEALLTALRRDPAQLRRRWLYGVTGVLAVGAAMAGVSTLGGAVAPAPCQTDNPGLERAWNEQRKAQVQERFVATGQAYAATSWAAVSAALDSYRDDWAQMHHEVCEATRVRGEQSETLLDLRMECLGRRTQELDALVTLLSEGAEDLVRTGVSAAGKLVPLSVCSDVDHLRAVAPLPEQPGQRAVIEVIRAKLAQAKAHEDAGRYARGLALAGIAVASAKKTGYAPILGEALTRNGLLALKTGDTELAATSLHGAVQAAASGRDDVTVARAWVGLLGNMQGPRASERGEAVMRAARAAVARAGQPPELEAAFSMAWGVVLVREGRLEQANAEMNRALEFQRLAMGDDHHSLAAFNNNLAVVHLQLMHLELSKSYLDRALDLQERYQGTRHPGVATMRANRASLFVQQGATYEARQELQRAIEIWEEAEASHTWELAAALNNLGHLDLIEGKLDGAAAFFRRALGLWEGVDPGHADVARALGNLGTTLQEQARFEEALGVLQRALDLAEHSLASDSSELASILTDLGLVYMGLGKQVDARQALERALAIRQQRPGHGWDLPRLRFALAKATLQVDPERAETLATAARAGYAELPVEHPMRRRINDVDGWIAARSRAARIQPDPALAVRAEAEP